MEIAKKGIAVEVTLSLLIAGIVSVSASYPAEGANTLLLRNLKVQDSMTNEESVVGLYSSASFSVSVENNNQSSQTFVVVFDVRDSDGISVMLELENGNAGKYSTTFARSSWSPDKSGTYTLQTFAISDSMTPEILSPVISEKFKVISWVVEEPNPQEDWPEPATSTDDSSEGPTLEELRQFALEKINEDRAEFGLGPVELSDNEAAQIHAQNMFKTRYLSHWMTNGEKPYMTYTRFGGMGYVAQNIAYWGYADDYDGCVSGRLFCADIDPWDAIEELEYLMVYDDADSDWGHRDNILDKYHTHVSIGIVYNDYFFSFVQNFENNYITKERATDDTPIIKYDEPTLTIEGKITEGQFSTLLGHANTITVYYDPLPTENVYKSNKHRSSYDSGGYLACVLQEQLTMYCPDAITVTAQVWQYENTKDYDTFLIRANLSSVLDEPGVYTIVLTAEPIGAGENAESWPAAAASIWYEG